MFLVIQVAIFFIAFFDASEEAAWSWPFREFLWKETPEEDKAIKEPLQKIAHDSGEASLVFACLLAAVACFIHYNEGTVLRQIFIGILSLVVTGFLYSLVFDPCYAKRINKSWDYLGEVSTSDNIWLKWFGRSGGQWKAVIYLAIIIVSNLIFWLWLN